MMRPSVDRSRSKNHSQNTKGTEFKDQNRSHNMTIQRKRSKKDALPSHGRFTEAILRPMRRILPLSHRQTNLRYFEFAVRAFRFADFEHIRFAIVRGYVNAPKVFNAPPRVIARSCNEPTVDVVEQSSPHILPQCRPAASMPCTPPDQCEPAILLDRSGIL